MNQPVWKRLMWMVIIWGGSVLALALVGMFFRVLRRGLRRTKFPSP